MASTLSQGLCVLWQSSITVVGCHMYVSQLTESTSRIDAHMIMFSANIFDIMQSSIIFRVQICLAGRFGCYHWNHTTIGCHMVGQRQIHICAGLPHAVYGSYSHRRRLQEGVACVLKISSQSSHVRKRLPRLLRIFGVSKWCKMSLDLDDLQSAVCCLKRFQLNQWLDMAEADRHNNLV